MKILRYEMMAEQTLLARLKKTQLKGYGQPYIYAHSHLEIREQVDPNSLIPAQKYVLESDFLTIEGLYKTFLQESIDIFALKGGILFWIEDETGQEEGPIPLIPPIIEESIEPDGQKVWLINDGMHRVYTSRKLEKLINIIFVQNVPQEYPYYAYPLKNGWSDVIEIKEIPDNFLKKEYRNKDNYKALFRNFNEILPGVQKQRKKTR
jgi:hypothetical protein